MRLRPLLPGQQAGVHCVRAGLTKSTSFPRAVRKGIGGEQGAMKEDCSNKISMQEKERRGTSRGGWGRRRKSRKEVSRGTLKQEVVMEEWWRDEVKNAGGKDEEGSKRIKITE